VESVDGQSI